MIYLVSLIFQKKMLKYQRKVRKYNSYMIKGYTEAISYLKTIKSLGIEDKKTKEFEKIILFTEKTI